MKKTIFFMLIAMVFSVSIFTFNIICLFNVIGSVGVLDGAASVFFNYLAIVIFCILVFSMCVLQLILIIRKTNFTNYTRLAYEEFKEKRIAKKENKRKAKIEKLQKQLNEIEKDA